MARGFAGAESLFVESASLPSTVPLAVAMWLYLPAAPADHEAIFQLSLDADNLVEVQWRTSGALRIRIKDSIGASTDDGAVLTGLPKWIQVIAAYTDDLQRCRLYVDGALDAQTTTARTPIGMDTLAIGDRPAHSTSAALTGYIAHVGIWNSEVDVNALQILPPDNVATDTLVGYWPLTDATNADIVGGLHFTATGTPTLEQGPLTLSKDGGEFATSHPNWFAAGTCPTPARGWR